jgi:N-acetylmuramic acid 6-phosphate etherase
MQLNKMPLESAIDLMCQEEAQLPAILQTQKKRMAQLIRRVAKAFSEGGRLLYVGAGTSGRLGVLDASECPPTFRTQPAMVQGIMAGGERALHSAVEGAEDDFDAGAGAVQFRQVGPADVVLGIAASGRTPFVWGALQAAREVGAFTVLLCFNPRLEIDRAHRPKLLFAFDLGPEVLTGSTRLKAGTATKQFLNCLTTLAMVRIGKVVENLMIDLNPSNVKLRDRAVRIVMELCSCSKTVAAQALEESNWVVKEAVARVGLQRRPSD